MSQNLEDFEDQFIARIVSLFSYQKKLFRNDIGTRTTAPKVLRSLSLSAIVGSLGLKMP